MRFPDFLDRNYRPEPGAAVALASVVRHYYESCAVQQQFDWQPPRIADFLRSKFPVGLWNFATTIGNLRGRDTIVISDLPLVVFQGHLLPRDLREDEWPIRPGDYQPTERTLTRNEMSARGWDRIVHSRAEIMAHLRLADEQRLKRCKAQ